MTNYILLSAIRLLAFLIYLFILVCWLGVCYEVKIYQQLETNRVSDRGSHRTTSSAELISFRCSRLSAHVFIMKISNEISQLQEFNAQNKKNDKHDDEQNLVKESQRTIKRFCVSPR